MIREFILDYIRKPFVIWAIFFNLILQFSFIPSIFDIVEWIVVSQIYLVIFFTSFVYSYLQQMLPIQKSMKEIKQKQTENVWIVPRLMTNRFTMNVALWLSCVLFFTGIWMSFGTLYPESIPDQERLTQLKVSSLFVGFALVPAIASYFSWDFDSYAKRIGVIVDKKLDLEFVIPVISLTFFLVLSYVAVIN